MPASASCSDFEVPAVRIIDPPVDFRAHFCHSTPAPMETHAFGFRLRANAPEGQKRFPISDFLSVISYQSIFRGASSTSTVICFHCGRLRLYPPTHSIPK
jgi:hypothetical protein